MHENKKLAPLTGIAFANNWLKNKLNLNSYPVKTTRMTTNSHWLHNTSWCGLVVYGVHDLMLSKSVLCITAYFVGKVRMPEDL